MVSAPAGAAHDVEASPHRDDALIADIVWTPRPKLKLALPRLMDSNDVHQIEAMAEPHCTL